MYAYRILGHYCHHRVTAAGFFGTSARAGYPDVANPIRVYYTMKRQPVHRMDQGKSSHVF